MTELISLIAILPISSAASVKGTVTDGRRPVGEAVVWLEGSAHATPLKTVIVQRNKVFTPHILVVPKGTTVSFPNEDNIFHNVFAEYNAKKFDLGMYPKGQTRTVTFDKVGLVSILCNLHSQMSAYIQVVDTPYYGLTDSSGKFSLSDVPAGSYVLHAWHESGKTSKQAISVSSNEGPITIKIAR